MNIDYSASEGKKIRGVVETVLSRGKVVFDSEYKGILKHGTCVSAAVGQDQKILPNAS